MKQAEPTEFATALRAAVKQRGLSLEELRRRLGRQGISVSLATLSYWQSGRSRPERAASLQAIGPLEEILGVPRGFLASRLPPGRHALTPPSDVYDRSLGQLDPELDKIDQAVAQLGLSYDDGLARISFHDRVEVRADRTEGPRDVRTVLVAQREGVARYPVWVASDDPGSFPIVTAVTHCRVGRIREFRELSGVAVEMLLERSLHVGETTLVEHLIEMVGQKEAQTSLRRVLGARVREVVLEIRFHPSMLPRRIEEVVRVNGATTSRELRPYASVQALFTDCPPGVYEVRWEW